MIGTVLSEMASQLSGLVIFIVWCFKADPKRYNTQIVAAMTGLKTC